MTTAPGKRKHLGHLRCITRRTGVRTNFGSSQNLVSFLTEKIFSFENFLTHFSFNLQLSMRMLSHFLPVWHSELGRNPPFLTEEKKAKCKVRTHSLLLSP